jgi:hypothetical protein
MLHYFCRVATIVVTSFAFCSAQQLQAGEDDEIVTGCHFSNAEWGSDAIDRCIKDNMANRALVLQYPARYKSSVSRCRLKNEYGWDFVKSCIDKDIAAETALAAYPKDKIGLIDFCTAEFGSRGSAVIKACVDKKAEEIDAKK